MPTTRLLDVPTASVDKARVIDRQDFMAVIMVGYGENLYPFNEGTNVVSKALIPVANHPIIDLVLNWVFESGIMDVLLLVPPLSQAAISNHLNENYSITTHPRARINLKQHDEYDDEDDEADAMNQGLLVERDGTARLLKRFRRFITTDFVLLPCDLCAPSDLPLAKVLDRHRSAPDSVMTAVLYEPVESVRESEEKLLVALDRDSGELLMAQPLDGLEDELDLRMSLITSHPKLSMTTRLLDAHIYVFRRTFLDLLADRQTRDLDSMREQVVPWLVKGSWQKGLADKWSTVLGPEGRDPLEAALERSTTQSTLPQTTSTDPSTPASQILAEGTAAFRTPSPGTPRLDSSGILSRPTKTHKWKCQVIVSSPPVTDTPETNVKKPAGKGDRSKAVAAPDPEYLVRANSLAGYWELNRRALRSMASRAVSDVPPSIVGSDEVVPPIATSAQISPDSLIGEGSRVGDRASIKKCIVGRHCVIGRGAKITGSVLWDFVVVEENARIENSILCTNVRIGDKSAIKDCELGTGFEAKSGANLKGERMVAGQEA